MRIYPILIFQYIGVMAALSPWCIVFLVNLQVESIRSPPLPPPCVKTIGVVTDIFGSDTFWLLLFLLPASWKIRIWPTSKGWHGELAGSHSCLAACEYSMSLFKLSSISRQLLLGLPAGRANIHAPSLSMLGPGPVRQENCTHHHCPLLWAI